ncbi:carboxylate--amine ligase, partial [Rhodococcus sp. C26F]
RATAADAAARAGCRLVAVGTPIFEPPSGSVTACWRAARDGLAGHGVDLGSEQLVPAVDLIRRLLVQVRPVLEELDAYRPVHDALAVTLDRGNGAIRQRRILERGGSFTEVVADATRRTVKGCTSDLL